MRDSVSTPIRSTVSEAPAWISASRDLQAVDEARARGVDVEAAACEAPSFSCTVHAHEGRMRSGVDGADDDVVDVLDVESRHLERALRAASAARSELSWPSATMRRSWMPVR